MYFAVAIPRPAITSAISVVTSADFFEKLKSWQSYLKCSTKKYQLVIDICTRTHQHTAATMGVQKKTRKFAQMKRVIGEIHKSLSIDLSNRCRPKRWKIVRAIRSPTFTTAILTL